MLTEVSGAPATTEDGVRRLMLGVAFEVGGVTTGVEVTPPPPHPAISHKHDKAAR
jgi:hypothetical protein